MEKWPQASLAILWLQLSWVYSDDKVMQSPPSLLVHEEDNATLNCRYEVTTFESLHWYKQEEKYPTFLFRLFTSGIDYGRIRGTLDKKERLSTLHITATQPGDSATYLCAVGGSAGQKLVFGQGTQLTVKPNIKNPDPAVYQPRSPKSSRTSICLFTDFGSNTNVSQATGSSAFGSSSTVLDMRSTQSKSYGALLWSDSTDFGCKGTFNETFYPSSEFSCDVTSVEKGFETDINLNFQNLSMIVFRILLLKVAGFNLLMTLRLWSS